MPKFSYKARSRNGERLDGMVDVPDRRAALLHLERLGLVPITVSEPAAAAAAAPATPAARRVARLTGRRRRSVPRMKLRELLIFTREVRDLLASGMTLGDTLNTLTRHQTHKTQQQLVTALRDKIIEGSSLSGALAQWPDSFPTLYVSMVRAGEASGDMAAVLEGLCRHFERVAEAREKVLMAMIYPAIIMIVGLATMLFAMIFVVPRFVIVFRDLGSSLPVPTLILMGLSNLLVRWGWLLLLTVLALGWLGRRALRRPRGRRWWDGMQLRLPLVRHIVTANAYAHFARTLGVLLGNGVPVLQALEIVEHTVGNQVLADEIREARDRVTDGTTISGPLAAGKIFPPLLTDMLAVGEKTGDLSGALGHIARRYDGELDRNIKIFTSVLEPMMILIMAVVVGFIAISLLLAVFDMTSGLKM